MVQWARVCVNDVGLLLAAAAMAYELIAWVAVRFARTGKRVRPDSRPPVSILKPLCGAEPHLYECLRSFCEQDYPQFQIVFGVSDPSDPAIAVVRRLQREFPALELVLSLDSHERGGNRKVSNLINMMPHVRHDYLVIADSDVRVSPDYLNSLAAPLQEPDVGLVTCPYTARPQPGLWSALGSVFINDWFMPSARVAAAFGSRAFAFGATIALRRQVLAGIGGFTAIADQLADDYRLGELTRRQGLRTVLSDYVVDIVVDEPSAVALVRHQLRWLRTIRSVRPFGYALAFITFSVPVAIVGCLLAGLSGSTAVLLTITLAARLLLHAAVCKPAPLGRQNWMLPLSDFLGLTLWFGAFFTRCVQWRHVRYRVARNGDLYIFN